MRERIQGGWDSRSHLVDGRCKPLLAVQLARCRAEVLHGLDTAQPGFVASGVAGTRDRLRAEDR